MKNTEDDLLPFESNQQTVQASAGTSAKPVGSVSQPHFPVLKLRDGADIILPPRKSLLGGLTFTRRFSRCEKHPYDEIRWERRDVRIMDWKTGKPIYERCAVEVPAHWDDNAVRITADKYLFGSTPGTPEYEDSFRQVFDRIANTYTVWGWEEGYFIDQENASIFNEEIKALLVKQIWAPNSPVWFNIGHWEQWRWGRPDLREEYSGHGNKAYYAKGDKENLKTFTAQSTYEFPQCSACFLTEVGDSMEEILEHLTTEGRIFASGSGVGVNISTLRSSKEPISGKGKSSGPISFDRGWDRMAGAIKSGGKTRRAARMVLMFSDHPDIFDFIRVKNRQEDIAKVILREHNVHVELRRLAEAKLNGGTPAERAAARVVLSLPLTTEEKFDPHMDALLYGETLSHQNANHSVSLKGDFWKAYEGKGNTYTRWVTNPARIDKTFRAEELLEAMAQSIWDNGEPGVHNNDIINLWNPVKSLGDITTSNPCSEYVFLNNTSCNLSSFNAYRFLQRDESGRPIFDGEALVHAARLAMICADLNVEHGGFPIPEIAEGTYRFRTTGIGFANVGGALMAIGVPYDSDEGRWIASQLCSLLTAACWKASAEMGAELGPFLEFPSVKGDLKEVLRLHAASQRVAANIRRVRSAKDAEELVGDVLKSAGKLPEAQGVTGVSALYSYLRSFLAPARMREDRTSCANGLCELATKLWREVLEGDVYRNAFVSVMAPTGTISAPLGCYDEGTTSIEPDYTLVKWKQLAGGGSLRMFNRLALEGLKSLGYDNWHVAEAAFEVAGLDGLMAACGNDLERAVLHLAEDASGSDAGPVRVAWRRFSIGMNEAGAVSRWLRKSRESVAAPDAGADELLVREGALHIEGVRWLDEEDLAVFDCAATNGNGTRAIRPEGHLLMLGALQPFISGACSKTVNLPVSATKEDIMHCLVRSHELGVKCIALFRAGSKANAVYVVDTPETRRFKAEHVWNQLVDGGKEAINEIIAEASKPRQKRLPGRRLGQTVKFSVGGQLSGYLTVGVYADGTCGEVFGRLGQVGSFASGMFEAYCKLLSTALQFGVPLKEVVKGFRNYSFEPSGFCRVGDAAEDDTCTEIRSCASVVDLIAKILAWLFPESQDYRLRDVFDVVSVNALGHTHEIEILPQRVIINEPQTVETNTTFTGDTGLNGASICPQCHSLSYVQDGKCKVCRSCGYKDGGCGE